MQNEIRLTSLSAAFIDKLKSQGKTLNTLKNYKTDLDCYKLYLESFQQNDILKETDLDHILEYGKFLQVKYTSDNSRRRRVQTLRLFYDFLLLGGYVSENPVRKIPASPKFVDVPKPTHFGETITWWTHLNDEVKTSQNGLPRLIAQRNQLIFCLVFFGGLKVSQLSKLDLKDLISNEEGELRVMVTHEKRDPYTVVLPEYLAPIIQAYKVEIERGKVTSGITFSQALFNANPYRILSGGLSSRGVEVIFEEIRGHISADATPKKLREAAICRWINMRLPATTVKEWMGVAPSYSLSRFLNISDNFFYSEDAYKETISES